tara:strand:- start:19 stop:663 length:645 start_codon:yes stop_codon:yes gene_type:complete
MFYNRFLFFILYSFLFGQEFDPETGDLIHKNFDPKTGELIKQSETEKISETKLKKSENTIIIEEREIKNTQKNLKANQVKNIKENSFLKSDFDKIYSEETMYIKAGFWSTGYEKNAKKISKNSAYRELEKFIESRNLYDQARLRLISSVFGAGLIVMSPVLGASTDNFMIFFAAYLGGTFTLIYNRISYSNLINKAVWIFNREALKANSNLKLK